MVNCDRIYLQLNTSRFSWNFDVTFEFPESKSIFGGIFKSRGFFKQTLFKKMSYMVVYLPPVKISKKSIR